LDAIFLLADFSASLVEADTNVEALEDNREVEFELEVDILSTLSQESSVLHLNG
jgi:hypothetical protein